MVIFPLSEPARRGSRTFGADTTVTSKASPASTSGRKIFKTPQIYSIPNFDPRRPSRVN